MIIQIIDKSGQPLKLEPKKDQQFLIERDGDFVTIKSRYGKLCGNDSIVGVFHQPTRIIAIG